MEFPTIRKNQISEFLYSGNFQVVRLDLKIDIEKYRKIVAKILETNALKAKDGYDKYVGIGLQYRDENNALYDSVEQLCSIDKEGVARKTREFANFRKKNVYGEQFQEIFNYFEPEIRPTRGRILAALAGFEMSWHTDGPHCGTVHIPIVTDSNCKILFEGSAHHLPADGSLYLLNASILHSVVNQSSTDRIHVTFPLSPLSFAKPNAHQSEMQRAFAERFELDLDSILATNLD